MKAPQYFGSLKDKVYDRSKIMLPGCLNYRERRGLTQPHGAEEEREWLALATETADRKGRKRTSPVLLTMQLNHGDMVVMHGADIQRHYEVGRTHPLALTVTLCRGPRLTVLT